MLVVQDTIPCFSFGAEARLHAAEQLGLFDQNWARSAYYFLAMDLKLEYFDPKATLEARERLDEIDRTPF